MILKKELCFIIELKNDRHSIFPFPIPLLFPFGMLEDLTSTVFWFIKFDKAGVYVVVYF